VNIDYINKPAEYPDIMKFNDLKNWLDKEIKEDDMVEIAGTGEPTLCEWLPDLLCYLDAKKAGTILRTNGFKLGGWRKTFDRLLVIIAKHDSSNEYMTDRLKYLMPNDIVLTGIDAAKQEAHDIASKTLGWLPRKRHNLDRAFFVTPDGKIRFMPCVKDDMGTVWDCKTRKWSCVDFYGCPFILNAYNFIEYLKSPFDLPDGYNHVDAGKWKQ